MRGSGGAYVKDQKSYFTLRLFSHFIDTRFHTSIVFTLRGLTHVAEPSVIIRLCILCKNDSRYISCYLALIHMYRAYVVTRFYKSVCA